MKLIRLIVIGRLLLVVVLLASVASACVSPLHPAEAVVQEYIEASILQDRDRAIECLESSLAAQLKEDDWVFSRAIRGLLKLKDVDEVRLHFDPWEKASATLKSGEHITPVIVPCQVLYPDGTLCWALKFYLAEEQGVWKIFGWEQDIGYKRP